MAWTPGTIGLDHIIYRATPSQAAGRFVTH